MATQDRSLLDVILGRQVDINQPSAFFFNRTSASTPGASITTENALKNPTVLSCVNLISQGIAQLDWGVHDSDDVFMPDNMLNGILNRPNAFQTTYEFKAAIIRDMLVSGNSFTRVVRAANGRVISLIPMDPEDVSLSANAFGIPLYKHKSFGDLTAQDVIHVRDISSHNIGGESRVLLAAERIAALNAADLLMGETFENGVSVNYSVELDGSMDDTTRKNLYEQLKTAFGRGGSRRGGVAVIEGGSMNAMKGSTPADADLRELRGMLINEIAALFRVPASMVGGTGNETFNNVTARLASLYRDTYQPLITNIEQAFSNNLTLTGNRIAFDVGNLVKGDLASQVTIASTAVAGLAIMTQNEARVFIGLPEISEEEYDLLGAAAVEEIDVVEEEPTAPEQVGTDDRRGENNTDEGNLGRTEDGNQ